MPQTLKKTFYHLNTTGIQMVTVLFNIALFFIAANQDEAAASHVQKCQGIVSVHIADAPDLTMRAVLLDLNPYGRVPTMVIYLGIYVTINNS